MVSPAPSSTHPYRSRHASPTTPATCDDESPAHPTNAAATSIRSRRTTRIVGAGAHGRRPSSRRDPGKIGAVSHLDVQRGDRLTRRLERSPERARDRQDQREIEPRRSRRSRPRRPSSTARSAASPPRRSRSTQGPRSHSARRAAAASDSDATATRSRRTEVRSLTASRIPSTADEGALGPRSDVEDARLKLAQRDEGAGSCGLLTTGRPIRHRPGRRDMQRAASCVSARVRRPGGRRARKQAEHLPRSLVPPGPACGATSSTRC